MERRKIRIDVKTISSMEKVFAEIEPAFVESGKSVFRKERLNFQIAIKMYEGNLLGLVTVVPKGELAPFVTIRDEGYVVDRIIPDFYTDDYYLKKTANIFPDVLKPFTDLNIMLTSNRWYPVWVSVDLDDTVKAGKYIIDFDILDKEKRVIGNTSYTVELIDEVLPQHNLKVTNWMHYDSICHTHKVEPFTEEFYKVLENYLKIYTDIGNNMLLVPLFTPPLDTAVGNERKTVQLIDIVKNGDKYEFNFDKLNYFIDFALARGVKYLEFSHLFTQWGGKFCPKIMATVDGEYKRIFGWETLSDSDEYVGFLNAFLPKVVALIKEKGLKDICHFHLTDEPSPTAFEYYEKDVNTVRPHLEGMPIMDAASELEFYENGWIDHPYCVTNAAGKYLEKGIKDLYVYYCCEPTNFYHSNRLISMPLQRMRILGYQLYLNNALGFLHWGYNFYNSWLSYIQINPYMDTNSGGYFPGGDGFIVYPTEDGAIYSLRAETHKEMFADYSALMLLEKYYGKEFVMNLLTEEGMSGYTTYSRSVIWHTAFREKINALIKAKLN